MHTLLTLEGLEECQVLERLNRFVVRVRVGASYSLAHNTNTGRLADVLVPGRLALCRRRRGRGKTSYSLDAVEYNGGFAIVNTVLQEEAFQRAVSENLVPPLKDCRLLARRPRLGSTFLDFLMDCGGVETFVEVKSAILRAADGYAMYPDCPSARGRRHVQLLRQVAARGYGAVLVFIAGFPGARGFRPNRSVDPKLAEEIAAAIREGVIVHAVGIAGFRVNNVLRVVLYRESLPVEL